MGALAAVSTDGAEDPRSIVETMLHVLSHRGAQANASTLGAERTHQVSLGYSFHHDAQGKFVQSDQGALAMNGSFFELPPKVQANQIFKRLTGEQTLQKGVGHIMMEPGAFAIICYRKNKLFAFRDVEGLKPLYYGRRRGFAAFASERKALWKIGLKKTNRVLPGVLYTTGAKAFKQNSLARISRPRKKAITLEQASTQLTYLLARSIRRVTKELDKVPVAFSGGLDSALTAILARKTGIKVELVSVGLTDSPELLTAEKSARSLDLPITIETFSTDALEEYIRRVVWLIEEPNLMKVSVAIPLHWAAIVAAKRGFTVMLCGQGSDELYGGYYKYSRILDEKGRRALVTELYRSIIDAPQANYERDDQATAPTGIELRTPFADLDVVRFSLQIPSEFKVKRGNDLTRKWVLRHVAKKLGLPDEIVWRRKRAIQHGTGVENAIHKLAKLRNLPVKEYLASIYDEVVKLDSIPYISHLNGSNR